MDKNDNVDDDGPGPVSLERWEASFVIVPISIQASGAVASTTIVAARFGIEDIFSKEREFNGFVG